MVAPLWPCGVKTTASYVPRPSCVRCCARCARSQLRKEGLGVCWALEHQASAPLAARPQPGRAVLATSRLIQGCLLPPHSWSFMCVRHGVAS